MTLDNKPRSSIPMPLEPSSINRAQNISQISRGRLVDHEMSVTRFSRDSREELAFFVQFFVSCTVPELEHNTLHLKLKLTELNCSTEKYLNAVAGAVTSTHRNADAVDYEQTFKSLWRIHTDIVSKA